MVLTKAQLPLRCVCNPVSKLRSVGALGYVACKRCKVYVVVCGFGCSSWPNQPSFLATWLSLQHRSWGVLQTLSTAASLFWPHLLVMCVSACGVLTCSCIDSIHMLCQLRCAARMTRACLLLHLSFLQRWRNAWPSPRLRAWPYLAPCLSARQMGAGCGTPLLRMMGSSYR